MSNQIGGINPLWILIAHLVKTDASFFAEYTELVFGDINEDQFQSDLLDLIHDRLSSNEYEDAFTEIRYGDREKHRKGYSYQEQLMDPLKGMGGTV